MTWRSAVTALDAANTSRRAASTSASTVSTCRCASAYACRFGQRLHGRVSGASSFRRYIGARGHREPRRFLTCPQILELGGDLRRPSCKGLDLMAVELLLLLSPADIEFSGVRLFPNSG